MGQSVKGVIQLVDPADAGEGVGRGIAGVAAGPVGALVPRTISFEAQLPRTDTGKLYKQELITKYSAPTPAG